MIEITVLGTIGEFIVGKTSRGVVVIKTYSKAIKCLKYINRK